MNYILIKLEEYLDSLKMARRTIGCNSDFSDDFIDGVQSAVDIARKEFNDVIDVMADKYEEKCSNYEE